MNLFDENGSFAVAGALFMVVFLLIAGLGVDVANYFNRKSKVQSIADGAALAGGNAMNQFADTPAKYAAINAALSHIKATQGDTYVDLYNPGLGHESGNIMIKGPLVDAEGDTFYKFGVVTFGAFEPYFLPRGVFGDKTRAIETMAVARVEGKHQARVEKIPLDCGLIVGKSDTSTGININGNNWSMDGGSMCSNADINFNKGKDDNFPINQFQGSSCSDNGSACPNHNPLDNVKTPPSFKIDSPSAYDVDLSNSSGWESDDCSGGSMEMETDDGNKVTWGSGGSIVCVSQTASGYEFTNETNEKMTVVEGGVEEPVSIWADDSVNFSANGSGINGGLYSTGDVFIDGNSHNFIGDNNEVGGLSMYAEGTVEVAKNNSRFVGILGAGEDLKFTSNGGGQNEMIGQVMVGDEFLDESNSNPVTDVTYDTSVFDQDAVDPGGWEIAIQTRVTQPYFANVSVNLIE